MTRDDSGSRDSQDSTDPRDARDAFREEWNHQRRSHRKRKERVLHTRISEDLSEEIRRLADDLRLPVSNLVRNVLEEAFSAVEAVSDNVGDLFEDVLGEASEARERIIRQMDNAEKRRGRSSGRSRRRSHRESDIEDELRSDEAAETPPPAAKTAPPSKAEKPPAKEFPDVLGWQPLVLNRQQACANCAVELQKGDRAFLGVKAGGLSELALCARCVRN
jgi:hypothetical protein